MYSPTNVQFNHINCVISLSYVFRTLNLGSSSGTYYLKSHTIYNWYNCLHSKTWINHGKTALYGLGPPLSEVTKSCAFVAVGDWSTGRATVLSILMCPPEPSGRQTWVRNGGFEFSFEFLLRIFITLKNPSTSVGIEPANLGSSGEHANH
jgi:hypothetical protein